MNSYIRNFANFTAVSNALSSLETNQVFSVSGTGTSNNNGLYKKTSSTTFVSVGGVPVGTIVAFAGSTIPDGWHLCDGSSFSSSTYPELYTALSSTTVLPDLRGRIAVGIGSTSKSSNNSDAISSVKTTQTATMQTIAATFGTTVGPSTSTSGVWSKSEPSNAGRPGGSNNGLATFKFESNASRQSGVGGILHGKQIGVNYIIKMR